MNKLGIAALAVQGISVAALAYCKIAGYRSERRRFAKYRACLDCHGTGKAAPFSDAVICLKCNGTGRK